MTSFTIRKGDRLPPLEYTLLSEEGAPIDLTGSTVRFHMRNVGTGVVLDAAATVVAPTLGEVKYSWGPTDTAKAGIYEAEFEITVTVGGNKRTLPPGGNLAVYITSDIA